MQTPGFWVFGVADEVWVIPALIDDSELSPETNFTTASSNGLAEYDGFSLHATEALILNICARILEAETRFVKIAKNPHYSGEVIDMQTAQDLARLIRRIFQSQLPDVQTMKDEHTIGPDDFILGTRTSETDK